MNSRLDEEKCEFCGKSTPRYKTIYVQKDDKKYQCSCFNCYNRKMAEYWGSPFPHDDIDPIILKDSENVDHTFHFTIRNLGDQVAIEAIELFDDDRNGYEFSYVGDMDQETLDLFGTMVERMLRALHRKHIEWSDTTDSWQITQADVVRARISCDIENSLTGFEHSPLIIIDGKEIKWEDFGQMLMTFEGFNFKLELFDKSEEMP